MRNISTEFKRQLFNNNRHYINTVRFTLIDGTVFTVENDHIMESGIEIDDAISEDDNFTALGATVINSCNLSIYNNDVPYSDFTFEYGEAEVFTGLRLPDGTIEKIKLGTFTVDDPTYGDYAITMSLLDHMSRFDKPYTLSTLPYPATLGEIVRDACYICDVSLNPNSLQFPHYDYIVQEFPTDKEYNFREVIGWCATIAGCFARCDSDGRLEFKWFNTGALEDTTEYNGGTFEPWTEGYSETINNANMRLVQPSSISTNAFKFVTASGLVDNEQTDTTYEAGILDGGTFSPWSEGNIIDEGSFSNVRNVHYINSLYKQDIAVDDVVITGVRITIPLAEKNEDGEEQKVVIQGTTDYCIDIKNNPFITESTINTVLDWLSTLLIGLRFRKCNVDHLSDPSIEAGDVGYVWDTKGNDHPILITRTTFRPTAPQTVICGASSPSRNSSTRFIQQTRSYVELRRQLRDRMDELDTALSRLQRDVDQAGGLYKTEAPDEESGAFVTYYHNKPELADSDIRIVISDIGITVTSNGTDEEPIWYGLRVDGEFIASIMNTIGINFDWGVGGELIIKRNGRETFYANATTGVVRIIADSFALSSGDTIESIANQSAQAILDEESQEAVFNKLTNNRAVQSITLQDGNIYINASYINAGTMSANRIKGGLLSMGGSENTNGRIIIYDDENNIIGRWDKNGIDVLSGSITGTTINVGGNNNVNGQLFVKNASGTTIGTWDKDGINVLSGSIKGSTITLGGNNNENGALYLKGSDGTTNLVTLNSSGLYVYAGNIQGPNVVVGGDNNENGQLIVRNASNAVIGRWNKDGITVTQGSISGNLITTGKIQALNGSAYFDLDNDILSCNQLQSGGNILTVSTETLLGASESSFKFSRGYDSRAIHICPTTAIPFIACKAQLNVCKIDANGNQKGYISLDNGYVDLGFGNDSLLELVSTGKIVTGGSVTQVDLPDNTRVYRDSAYTKVAVVSSSSKRYKHDINYELTDDRAEDNLLSLPVAEFVFNDDHAVQYADMRGKTIPGIIAEDVAEIYPSAAIYNDDNKVESWDERRLIPPMLKLIQKQHTKIEEQQAEIDDLKQRLERLEKLLL